MADLVNEMLSKFAELAQNEKNISDEMETAFKEYNEYCSSSDADLSEKLQQYRKKIAKVEELMSYAREHAQPQDLEEAQMPFETSESSLESLRQTIKLDSHHDPNAESLYTKASGQKLFYQQEIERTKNLIEGSKVQAKRQYDSDVSALEQKKVQNEEDEKAYIQSEDFKQYLKLLAFDKSAFNSQGTVNLLDKSSVSIGQRRVKLSVPIEIEQELSMLSKGEYNSAARTIGAPFGVSTQKGSVLMLDYDDRNESYLLGGVQRLLLNFIKYFGADIKDMYFCDPIKCNPDILGILSVLAKGINPFIIVPQSIAEAASKLAELTALIEQQPVSGKVTRIIVLHGFSENYGSEMTENVLKISALAENSGTLLILTHNNSNQDTDIEKKVREKSVSIRSRNGAFWIENTRESLFWYSAPSEIPDEVRRIYVEQRRQQASQATHDAPVHQEEPTVVVNNIPAENETAHIERIETPAAAETADTRPVYEEPSHEETAEEQIHYEEPASTEEITPAEEETADDSDDFSAKGRRSLREITIGKDMNGNNVSVNIDGNVSYICGNRSFDRLAVIKEILNQSFAKIHPDDAEMWIFDTSSEITGLVDKHSPYIRYAVADNDPYVAYDIAEKLCSELNSRINIFSENKWKNYSEVPTDVYMPRIVVFINNFPEFICSVHSAPIIFGRNAEKILTRIFSCCGNYGIDFVLIGETFTVNGNKPDCLKNVNIHCAAAVSGKEIHAEMLFEGANVHDNQIGSLKSIPANCAFVCVPEKNKELSLVRIVPKEKQETPEFTAIDEYSEDFGSYVNKHALIADRSKTVRFDERSDSRTKIINSCGENEIMLFFGEPCRLADNIPVTLQGEFGENILALAPVSQSKFAANAVSAAIMSLKEQSVEIEIITARNDPVYKELYESGIIDGIAVYEGENGENRIKEIAADLNENRSKRFVIILGGNTMLAAMAADDASSDLKKLLIKGSRTGCHVMLVCGKVSSMAAGFISLFRHKAVFPCCPYSEAEKLLRCTECDLPEGAFRLSDDYEEFSFITYSI